MKNYLQKTTVWEFENRGTWATHTNSYRGNWTPHVPRNLILRYSKQNDIILDMFMGGGTTLIEAKLLNRNAIGFDINPSAVEKTISSLNFKTKYSNKVTAKVGSALQLKSIENDTIDLICTHLPYADIIKYSDDIIDDLSLLDKEEFIVQLQIVADEAFRVLKSSKICSLMIGDIRKDGLVYPLGFETMKVFTNSGFILKEIIIKKQFNCKSTEKWRSILFDRNMFLLEHEYIFVMFKP